MSKETIGGSAKVVEKCALADVENQPCQWSEDGKCPEKCEHFTSTLER